MPQRWSASRRQPARAPRTINLIVDITANGGTTADELYWRGAAACWLADHLTEAGFSVGIYAADTTDGLYVHKSDMQAAVISVKEPNQLLDLSSVAAVVCMAGFFRLAMFGYRYASEDEISSGLGMASTLERAFPKDFAAMNGIGGFSKISTQADAVAFITKTLGKIQENKIGKQA